MGLKDRIKKQASEFKPYALSETVVQSVFNNCLAGEPNPSNEIECILLADDLRNRRKSC